MAAIGSPEREAESKAPLIYGLSIAFVVLSCVSVLLRLYTRLTILHTFASEDAAIIVAQILSFGVTITTILQVALGGLGRHTEFVGHDVFLIAAKTLYASTLIYNAAQIVTKLSFLLQYRRLFPSCSIRRICTFGMVLLILWGVIQQFITAFSCFQIQMILPQWVGRQCVSTPFVYNTNAVTNIATDFAIFAIPIRPVMLLKIPTRRKVQLMVVFCLGFCACAISIIRLVDIHRYNGSRDPAWDSASIMYWSAIELNIGILCACLPTLRPLIRKVAPQILGSSLKQSGVYKTHKLATIASNKPEAEFEDGIYIHKDSEFQSTTELHPKEITANPFAGREAWLETSSMETNKGGK